MLLAGGDADTAGEAHSHGAIAQLCQRFQARNTSPRPIPLHPAVAVVRLLTLTTRLGRSSGPRRGVTVVGCLLLGETLCTADEVRVDG